MPFTVDEFRDLIRLLEERPEWRNELRHLLLSDTLLAMPEQLAASRLETDRHFQELAAQMAALVQEHRQFAHDQIQLTRRVDDLTQQLILLTQRVDDLTQRVDVLTQRVDDLAQLMAALTRRVESMGIDLADLKGDSLERRYRERAPAYFGRLIRRTRALTTEDVAALVDDAVDRGLLAEAEANEITWADLVVRGKRREDGTDVYLVVEVSWSVDQHDVERAALRATLFSRLGLPALAVVAGKTITDEASRLARTAQVLLLLDGQISVPQPTSPM